MIYLEPMSFGKGPIVSIAIRFIGLRADKTNLDARFMTGVHFVTSGKTLYSWDMLNGFIIKFYFKHRGTMKSDHAWSLLLPRSVLPVGVIVRIV